MFCRASWGAGKASQPKKKAKRNNADVKKTDGREVDMLLSGRCNARAVKTEIFAGWRRSI